jgi:hypothetical protein
VNWKGGGGFRYYKLAPSLLEKDKWGNWVINKKYNAAMLAEALCKLESFTYAPSDTIYWQHGYSTERDFIYVTTQNSVMLNCSSFPMRSEKAGLFSFSAPPSVASLTALQTLLSRRYQRQSSAAANGVMMTTVSGSKTFRERLKN